MAAEKETKGKGTAEGTKAVKPEEKKPETVGLKEIAKQVNLSPREARSILRKLGVREEGLKRSRWTFAPKDVAGVVAKLKKAIEDKAKAAEAKATESEEEEEDES